MLCLWNIVPPIDQLLDKARISLKAHLHTERLDSQYDLASCNQNQDTDAWLGDTVIPSILL